MCLRLRLPCFTATGCVTAQQSNVFQLFADAAQRSTRRAASAGRFFRDLTACSVWLEPGPQASRLRVASAMSAVAAVRGGCGPDELPGTARSPAQFSLACGRGSDAPCRWVQAGRTPAVPVGRMKPELALSRSRSGPEFGRGPAEGMTQLHSRLQTRFSRRSFVSRLLHFLPSAVRPASRLGPGRCSSRRRRCEVPRDCESGSCHGGS